jgi:hypothetical protein
MTRQSHDARARRGAETAGTNVVRAAWCAAIPARAARAFEHDEAVAGDRGGRS